VGANKKNRIEGKWVQIRKIGGGRVIINRHADMWQL
jgi:hypothetical protein